jgi:hypothetical protein
MCPFSMYGYYAFLLSALRLGQWLCLRTRWLLHLRTDALEQVVNTAL